MDLKRFKEDCIFSQFKDKPFKNAVVLKGAITKHFKNMSDKDIEDIYTRIVNYQIEKYGNVLHTPIA